MKNSSKNTEINNLHDLKINLYWFKATKRQFFIIYSLILLIFSFLFILSFFIEPPDNKMLSTWQGFYYKYDEIIWGVSFLGTIMEAQFYWNRFTKKQLDIITEQKEVIFQKNEELLQQNDEIATQKDEIESQKENLEKSNKLLSYKNDQINKSINYAQRIQAAILPDISELSQFFSDYFVFWLPKDIVSGDFYWFKKVNNKIVITVADCTGHGVPGAFVSMLGVSFLNEIIRDDYVPESNIILEKLRKLVKKSLHQEENQESKDGMDITLLVIDKEYNTIQYSGANNSLYFFRNNELNEIKADRNPIGIYLKERPFKMHEFSYQKNDIFYLFSDGYADQLGGQDNTKYKIGHFKDFLSGIHKKPLNQQINLIESNFHTWKQNTEQIDDVLLIGIQI